MNQFAISTHVIWGENKYQKLISLYPPKEFKRILIIADSGISTNPQIIKIRSFLDDNGYDVCDVCTPNISSEPTYDDLDFLSEEVKQTNPDMIIGIGGGTILDLAKGVSVLMTNKGKGVSYRGMNKVGIEPLTYIAIPTTAGTGSEVTWTAAFIDNVDKMKLGINGKNVAPACAILDPKFLYNCPNSVAISSGLDAMVHSVEAITAKTSTVLTESLGITAFSIMYQYLPKFLSGNRSMDVCENLLLSSYIAGIAMMNAGGGPASGISYPLGVHYNVPHGFAGGVFLPHVFKVNVNNGYKGYENLCKSLCDYDHLNKDPSRHFLDLFNKFYNDISGPSDLRTWNCSGDEDIKKLKELTLEQRIENLELNPINFSESDLEEVLKASCK